MKNETAVAGGFDKQEPIPGYVTKELLGSGGYGEVWKAHAPGGLFKAVKFIYADMNSKRASRELRSLNRIKEVRHPFLLSIERIEVIDGNVVIVTELADQSLKRHYQKLRAKDLPGIPRDELLGYLRDTADALDYIYDNYSLQHLDIKPENLLLVGNRAKVADFGLIKNLYDRSSAMVEGLTPIYAPPELFDGKPNRHSDQYSLAIVYQEMLTGELPFDGTTAARLAAQHLHMAPTLTALPKCDQPVIARALTKIPDQRFPNCRALVEALVEAGKTKQAAAHERRPTRTAAASVSAAPCRTESLDDCPIGAQAPSPVNWSKPRSVAELPPIEIDDQSPVQYEPVVFIGIGGTATRVVRRLRQRLHDRLGPIEGMPSLEMLLIDTDVKGLSRATEGEPGLAVDPRERLPMPLRRTEDYRSAGNILSSISRRWLYNIPYSLQTEGFRPLGRLAMVDHAKRLMERLRQALLKITSDESIAKTSRTSGLEFASRQPRVFIVASTAGGTGSGMVLDVAYAVRSVLANLDLPDGNVHGILLHSTGRGPGERDKAIANTYSALSELWHYSRPGRSYPGERACGVPPFHGNNRTFSSCYFLHLGDDLTELQLDVASDPVAEYLYSSTVTPAARFFDRCRHMEYVRWGTELTEPVLRSFGLCQFGGSNSEIPTIVGELLCRDLVGTWRSGVPVAADRSTASMSITMALTASLDEAKHPGFEAIDAAAAAKADELGVSAERMKKLAHEILEQELGTSLDAYFARLVGGALQPIETQSGHGGVSQAIAAIDAVLAGDDENGNEAALNSVNAVLNARVEGRAGKLAAEVCDWIFELVDAPEGVDGAKHAAEWFQNHLRELQGVTAANIGHLREQALALQHALLRACHERRGGRFGRRSNKNWLNDARQCALEYAQVQVDQVVACSITRWLRLVESQVTAHLDRLQVFWKDLNALAGAFHVVPSLDEVFDACAEPESIPSHWRGLLNDLIARRRELIAQLDREIEEKLGVGAGKLRWYLTQNVPIHTQLAAPLRAAARHLVLAAMEGLNVSRLQGGESGPASSCEYQGCVQAAQPRLSEDAAGTRVLLIVPPDIDEASIRQRLAAEGQSSVTIAHSDGGDFIACQEAELLEIRRVAARLVDHRRDYIDVANRLHTRSDVPWDDMPAGDVNEQP